MSETADDLHRLGLMDAATHAEITALELRKAEPPTAVPLTGGEIRAMRERAHLSQAAFAHRLNLTTGYVSQLERGARHPKGATLALLNIIRRHGIELTQG